MADARTIIDGTPGETWLNDTGLVYYQFHVSGSFTCGICWQYNGKIARYWPIPIHKNCRCRQSVCKPGARAPRPFVDFEKEVAKLPKHQQAAVMGKSLFQLWRKDVVTWQEAVTPGRIRTLEEIVARQRLTVETMVKNGVAPHIAKAAYRHVNTPEHELIDRSRRELIDRLAAAHKSHEALAKHLGAALAGRVGIEAGPSYTTRSGDVLPGIQEQALWPDAATRAQHAAKLVAALASTGARRRRGETIDRHRARVKAELEATTQRAKERAAQPERGARTMADVVAYAKSVGHELAETTTEAMVRDWGYDRRQAEDIPLLYRTDSKRIHINTTARTWKGDAAWDRKVMGRQFVLPTLESMVDHEIGHLEHHRAIGDRITSPEMTDRGWMPRDTPEQVREVRRMVDAVSVYATSMPVEFVAEVYAGMKGGRKFPAWVMDLYRQFEGPQP